MKHVIDSLRLGRSIALIFSLFLLLGCLQASVLSPEESTTALLNPRIIWSASSILRSVDGQAGNGFVETEYRDDHTFVQTMRVNLLPIKEGKYEAWLVREDPLDTISLGALESPKGDGSYFLRYQKVKDLRDHQKVVVTWEPKDDNDPLPGDRRIVEGVLRILQSSE